MDSLDVMKRNYTWTKPVVPPHERILRRLPTLDLDVCWDWPGATAKGYGVVTVGSRADGTRRLRQTHVLLFEHFIGEVPEGLELDHLCKRRICCNPRHLDPVTHVENCRRAAVDNLESLRQRLVLARAAWSDMRKVA